jgi:hypothetical protein
MSASAKLLRLTVSDRSPNSNLGYAGNDNIIAAEARCEIIHADLVMAITRAVTSVTRAAASHAVTFSTGGETHEPARNGASTKGVVNPSARG